MEKTLRVELGESHLPHCKWQMFELHIFAGCIYMKTFLINLSLFFLDLFQFLNIPDFAFAFPDLGLSGSSG